MPAQYSARMATHFLVSLNVKSVLDRKLRREGLQRVIETEKERSTVSVTMDDGGSQR